MKQSFIIVKILGTVSSEINVEPSSYIINIAMLDMPDIFYISGRSISNILIYYSL